MYTLSAADWFYSYVVLPQPCISWLDRFVTGGTDNHLLLWDLRPCGTSGRVMETVCDEVGISLNKNTVPGDASALSPSGVRIGTPGITTRGMTEEDMYLLADLLERAVNICIKVEGKS
eukprot:GHVN01015731.1.p1 GENE.GHVN01015731.1~~GHVN01015731.1.p1  ORF type:complete len:118 (-),score=10.82 GHVN01015731.1:129-482(-)